ncbi:MAG TPA: hypothetical protein PLL71_04140 [Agriterribacter sp.]|nr:hypothetical protein [Agriterribacter sp.]HRQ49118.1 hypothetical protein [Agriterribacter sp.]
MKSLHFNLRKTAVLAAIGFCCFVFEANAQDETKTVSGEVLDMACYMAKGAHGEKHKGCAAACIKGGAPMGLLTGDGTIYLLVEDHNNKEVYAKVKDHAGEKITVTGTASVKGGLQGLIVEALKEER